MYLSFTRNYGMEIHIARFHNIFGPYGTWEGGKEKAPAAICRKVAEVPDGGEIEIWGDGEQTRTFLYIDECIEGLRHLMESKVSGPVNIGSDELISINNLAKMGMEIAGKKLKINHIPGPLGVRGRSSENTYIKQTLGWRPSTKLIDGMKITYNWIAGEVEKRKNSKK
jgi:nucleoside-diphosphate-sugar epimerase